MIFDFRKREKVKITYLLIGLMFLIAGIGILLDEPEYKKHAVGGFSDPDRWGLPIHNHLIGAGIFVFSLTLIFSAFLELPENGKLKSQKMNPTHIWVSCGDIIAQKGECDCPCKRCGRCGGRVESIKSVLDRHPEVLKKLNTKS